MGRNSPANGGRDTTSDIHPDAGHIETVETIPVIEEQVEIGKRVVDGKTVRVTTSVVGDEVLIDEPVRHEDVTVERVAVGKVVKEIPKVREEEDLTIIPVVEERVRIVRELVLKEEIHLRRQSTTSTHSERVMLNKTVVEIEEDSGSAKNPPD